VGCVYGSCPPCSHLEVSSAGYPPLPPPPTGGRRYRCIGGLISRRSGHSAANFVRLLLRICKPSPPSPTSLSAPPSTPNRPVLAKRLPLPDTKNSCSISCTKNGEGAWGLCCRVWGRARQAGRVQHAIAGQRTLQSGGKLSDALQRRARTLPCATAAAEPLPPAPPNPACLLPPPLCRRAAASPSQRQRKRGPLPP
jgi:hypothetical protein